MSTSKKIQIYIVDGEKERFNENIWKRINHIFEVDVHHISLEQVASLANKKVHAIIFEHVSSKSISYAAIDAVQKTNNYLHTVVLTDSADMKSITRFYENHIDYVLNATYDDDYIVAVLITLLKRKSPKYYNEVKYDFKDITVDIMLNEIKIKGGIVDTTKKEFAIIKKLVKNSDKFLTKPELFQMIWGYEEDTSRVLDQYLYRIKKILEPSAVKVSVDREKGVRLV